MIPARVLSALLSSLAVVPTWPNAVAALIPQDPVVLAVVSDEPVFLEGALDRDSIVCDSTTEAIK